MASNSFIIVELLLSLSFITKRFTQQKKTDIKNVDHYITRVTCYKYYKLHVIRGLEIKRSKGELGLGYTKPITGSSLTANCFQILAIGFADQSSR